MNTVLFGATEATSVNVIMRIKLYWSWVFHVLVSHSDPYKCDRQ